MESSLSQRNFYDSESQKIKLIIEVDSSFPVSCPTLELRENQGFNNSNSVEQLIHVESVFLYSLIN